MFTVAPPTVGHVDGRVFGLAEQVDVVEVKCPICGCDRLNLMGKGYECCQCGMQFETKYPEAQNE